MVGMSLLIAEDLLLLLLDDDTGKLTNAMFLDVGLGGAVLVELALAGSVEVEAAPGRWSRAKVRATTRLPPADPVLREALAVVAEKERASQDLVSRLGRKRREPLLDRLAAAGIVRLEQDKVLGLFPRRRWPAVDSDHEAVVRHSLRDALLHGAQPDERTAALIALLAALDVVHKVVDRRGVPAKEVKRRAREIAEGDWAAGAVKDAVSAAHAAVAASAVVVAAAGASGS